MPKGDRDVKMYGFQLWANLPAKDKMMNPRYRDVTADDILQVQLSGGATAKIIAGEVSGVKGPVRDVVTDPEYIDVTVPEGSEFSYPTKRGYTVFVYVIGGRGFFCRQSDPFSYEVEGRNYLDMQREPFAEDGTLVLCGDGDRMMCYTEEQSVRFLLISGKPLNEPVAWHDPIVMNTREELHTAFQEYQRGTFIKYKG
jgi:hypothetical protein